MLEQLFWLDPRDPHRLRAAVQAMTEPHVWRSYSLDQQQEARVSRGENFMGLSAAVHRIIIDGLTPERVVDEAIARVHQILSE